MTHPLVRVELPSNLSIANAAMMAWVVRAAVLYLAFGPAHAFAPASRVSSWTTTTTSSSRRRRATAGDDGKFALATRRGASTVKDQDVASSSSSASLASASPESQQQQQQRVLGAQELLMLPRQYKQNSRFPPMNHVSVALLEITNNINIDDDIFRRAVQLAAQSHGLLRSVVVGDGEPDKRIDLFQMVRSGDPHPPTFCVVDDDDSNNKIPISIIDCDSVEQWQESWRNSFRRDLDDGTAWCDPYQQLLWKLELHRAPAGKAAVLLSFNHAISDQTSANRLLDQILSYLVELEHSNTVQKVLPPQHMPPSMEDALIGGSRYKDIQTASISPKTLSYVAAKAVEGLKDPVILPDDAKTKNSNGDNALLGALTVISGNTAGGSDTETRSSTVQFRSLSQAATARLLQVCRERGVTMSNALTAAAAYTASDFVIADGGATTDHSTTEKTKQQPDRHRNYKILQSLDMRRFRTDGTKHDATVSCMAGSHDLLFESLRDANGAALRRDPTPQRLDDFWQWAKVGKDQTEAFIDAGGPYEAVRVFDFAMTISDLNNLVHLTSQSKDTKGRAYSAGVTNAGVLERQPSFFGADQPISLRYGSDDDDKCYKITDVFYATPHVTSGCLYPISGMTVDGSLKFTFNPVAPIVSAATNEKFADAFIELLETVSSPPTVATPSSDAKPWENVSLPKGILTKATLALGLLAVSTHANAYNSFIQSILEMKANVANAEDFWAALNFWIFFAVGHPILQPILWISDVLHGSPGPLIAGLVPLTFLLGNVVVLTAIAVSSDVRMNYANNCTALILFSLSDPKRRQYCCRRRLFRVRGSWAGRHCWSGRFQPRPGRQLQGTGRQGVSGV
jgi:hypothetical protein